MEQDRTLRHPVVSGLFYPDDERELAEMVDGYLAKVDSGPLYAAVREQTALHDPEALTPIAIVAPHAGYIFSGAVQAFAYRLLMGREIDTAVIIGPAHQVSFKGISINLDGAFETPLGLVDVDLEFASALISHHKHIHRNEESHLSEHSVEVQLPFLQRVLPKAKIVAVLIGDQRWETSLLLKDALQSAMERNPGRRVVIASSDLSHYHAHFEALELDGALIKDLRSMSPKSFNSSIQSGSSEACGFGGILTAMMLAVERGKGKSAVLAHKDSGEISGDRKRVVGYLAAALY